MIKFAQFTHVQSVLQPDEKAIIFVGKHQILTDISESVNGIQFKDNLGNIIDVSDADYCQPVELSLCTKDNIKVGDTVYFEDCRIAPKQVIKIDDQKAYFMGSADNNAPLSTLIRKIATISKRAIFAKNGELILEGNYKLLAENKKTGDTRNINSFTNAQNLKKEKLIALLKCPSCGDFK